MKKILICSAFLCLGIAPLLFAPCKNNKSKEGHKTPIIKKGKQIYKYKCPLGSIDKYTNPEEQQAYYDENGICRRCGCSSDDHTPIVRGKLKGK
jgi:hypothetical protein